MVQSNLSVYLFLFGESRDEQIIMVNSSYYDVIIVGAGPAGLATALHLAHADPSLAQRTLVLEAATHPRRKVCGGAITFHGAEQLRNLGLNVDVPAATVHNVAFRFGDHQFTTESQNTMQVVQREAFDASLASEVRLRGIEIRGGERLQDLRPISQGIELTTSQGIYQASVVVGADGANSVVRQKLGIRSKMGVARLLRAMTPVDEQTNPAFTQHTAVFDFTCMQQGVQGYVWDFPCFFDGHAFLNRGIFDSRIASRPRSDLKSAFAKALTDRGVAWDSIRLEGHPVRWFNPRSVFARPQVLLTGDAAGVDPLFAEGISYAMEYGAIAANTIVEAFSHKNFTFADYRDRILQHNLGRMLLMKVRIAKMLYRLPFPMICSLLWRFAELAPPTFNHRIGAMLGVFSK